MIRRGDSGGRSEEFKTEKKYKLCMVWYGMVWYGMVCYGMVWYGMVWYGVGRLASMHEELLDPGGRVEQLHKQKRMLHRPPPQFRISSR